MGPVQQHPTKDPFYHFHCGCCGSGVFTFVGRIDGWLWDGCGTVVGWVVSMVEWTLIM